MALRSDSRPFPAEFLAWQVALRRRTMLEQNGAPHAGVAPLVVVRQPGLALGVSVHSVICGLLPRPDLLAVKTSEFRSLYESGISEGSRAVYDRGIAYLEKYYAAGADAFDTVSVTTMLHRKMPLVDALRAESRCALVFYVFDLVDRSEEGRLRCIQLDCSAEVLEKGEVFDNVWWHNTLFHGPSDEQAVVHFRHRGSWDTRFGAFEAVPS